MSAGETGINGSGDYMAILHEANVVAGHEDVSIRTLSGEIEDKAPESVIKESLLERIRLGIAASEARGRAAAAIASALEKTKEDSPAEIDSHLPVAGTARSMGIETEQ